MENPTRGRTVSPPLASLGDTIPQDYGIIEIRVGDIRQIFNSIDPSPFRERDLDPRAEQFIVEWARDLPADVPLALLIHLTRTDYPADDVGNPRDSVREYFGQRAIATRRRLRELFRRGRTSLAIALAFLTTAIVIGDAVANYFRESHLSGVLREGFLIGGWVAMWRPLEVFLFDWWPIRAEARLFDRLSIMPVRIVCEEGASVDTRDPDSPAGGER